MATKADQVQKSKAEARRREVAQALGLKPEELAWVSSKENWGIGPLRDEANRLLNA